MDKVIEGLFVGDHIGASSKGMLIRNVKENIIITGN
jgi:hypothetical protein